ncbi:MAG TPA: 50S ribosomal protein L17 [Leptospiraceae bacterium]|jgi:large subunit ribosomal protein L17|nr:50S ribosomal protein L17 [Leptospirales bacterium]HMU83084.1 50S ribosomal protein L17 [Leptospiraceae bacterium]HMW59908.1 50S ribosomal protein L17 [Leptospiraceae bacterium]HMX57430.1 50S ribosomal protein L17 [Leptospiraceae bacterium]HMY44774.1 50S ribosomal protein L17 [Leptospiraceae bacterium]
MRKRNKTKQLNRVSSHRKAMMRNMATSLFDHERIISTRAKVKVLRPYAEKLITRAKHTVSGEMNEAQVVHSKREILKHVRDRDVAVKLLQDIAPRFKERNGGYLRIIHLPERDKDSAKMSIIELVERKEKVRKQKPEKERKASSSPEKGKDKKSLPSEKDAKKEKWYNRFRKKKSDVPS